MIQILLARKPIDKKTVAENILGYNTGGINIDKSRIGTNDNVCNHGRSFTEGRGIYGSPGSQDYGQTEGQKLGRFPANIILSHHPECKYLGEKKVKGQENKPTNRTKKGQSWDEGNCGLRGNMPKMSGGFGDNEGNETIENYECHRNCKVKMLDKQSGMTKNTRHMSYKRSGGEFIDSIPNQEEKSWWQSEEGTASRFYKTISEIKE